MWNYNRKVYCLYLWLFLTTTARVSVIVFPQCQHGKHTLLDWVRNYRARYETIELGTRRLNRLGTRWPDWERNERVRNDCGYETTGYKTTVDTKELLTGVLTKISRKEPPTWLYVADSSKPHFNFTSLNNYIVPKTVSWHTNFSEIRIKILS